MTDRIIKKDKEALIRISKALKEHGIFVKEGDIIIKADGRYSWYYKVEKIVEKKNKVYTNGKVSGYETVVCIYVISLKELKEDGTYVWEENSSPMELDEFVRYKYNCVLPKSISEMQKDAIAGLLKTEPEEVTPESTSTEVGFTLGKDQLEDMKDVMLRKANDVLAMDSVLHIIMRQKMNELERIRNQFLKVVAKIHRVIGTIELYLGINEDIIQIREGAAADINYPIYLRQQKLYMDEEVASIEDQGIDFRSIEVFDNWIAKEENLNIVLPEKKGVIVLQVRRSDKYYTSNHIDNTLLNDHNKRTYILIRNGDNLYRIWSDLQIGDRLFPLHKELQDMIDTHKDEDFEEMKELMDDAVFYYKRNFVVLQGLIERTPIFTPLPVHGINFFHPESYGDFIQFIYDDEISLPSGRLSYRDWKKKINSSIKRGTRVFIGSISRYEMEYAADRMVGYRNSSPPKPDSGIYEVYEDFVTKRQVVTDKTGKEVIDWEKTNKERKAQDKHNKDVAEDKEKDDDWFRGFYNYDDNKKRLRYKYEDVKIPYFYIKYNPGDTVYGGWGSYDTHERKNKLSFKIYVNDNFVFDYDLTSLEDVEFYLKSRVDRPDYLNMFPILQGIKRLRLQETEQEKQFGKLVLVEIMKQTQMEDSALYELEILLEQCIHWWKMKVIWKRPITKEDAKAWRMIKGRMLKILKERRVL